MYLGGGGSEKMGSGPESDKLLGLASASKLLITSFWA